jgi:uncharacterized protein YdaU (DUF1376 family)
MAEFPAMPLWTDAYLADTRHLSTLEHGAYLLLLMEAWRRPTTTLPDDDRLLARLAGVSAEEWEAMREIILAFFQRDGRSRTLKQKRLFQEATYVREKSRSQRDKVLKRWEREKNNDTAELPLGIPDGYRTDTPTPTPTPIEEKDKPFPEGYAREHAPARTGARAARTRGVTIPDDFAPVLTPHAQAIVDGWPPGSLEREVRKFRDKAEAHGWTYKDWQAAFRTWIGNAEDWRNGNGGNSRPSGATGARSSGDGFIDAIREHRGGGAPGRDR